MFGEEDGDGRRSWGEEDGEHLPTREKIRMGMKMGVAAAVEEDRDWLPASKKFQATARLLLSSSTL